MRAISKYHIQTVKATDAVSQIQQLVLVHGKQFIFKVDTGAGELLP